MSRMINIYLLRHGKTVGEPALYGHTDVEVDQALQQQICDKLLSQQWTIEQIVTSPLKRCKDLALKVSDALPQASLSVNQDFKEIHFGDLDGKPFESAKQYWPELELFWQNPAQHTLPNAESLQAFNQRITKSWEQLVLDVEKDTLVICHGGTIRMILASLLPIDWQSSALYSVMQIGHQSFSHIQITKADAIYKRVCSIASPLV